LVKRYRAVEAVAGISFRVERGSIFGLLGRNGAGKTTTLESCVGLVRPTAGTIRILGLDPSRSVDLRRLRFRFGVQLQATSLPEKAKTREILDLYATYYHLRPNAEAIAARVGLEDKLDRFVGVMSGGEQQRLALALALQHDPDVLFLDEPSAGMDAFGRRILWGEVERLRAAGKAIVLTTHYIEEAERLCDQVCVVQQGRIVAQDTPRALIERYGGAARIAFVAAGFTPDDALHATGTWTRTGDRWIVLTSREPGHVLAQIVTHANESNVPIDDLELRRPGLEDAFLALTGEQIEEHGGAAA
jgi:ABC-2 type transport system ATP-binding protein